MNNLSSKEGEKDDLALHMQDSSEVSFSFILTLAAIPLTITFKSQVLITCNDKYDNFSN